VKGFKGYVDFLDDIRDDVVEYLGVGDYRTVENSAIALLEKNGVREIEKGTGGFIQLCRGILQAQLKLSGAF
jgi:hypothetical protein